jgi:hypothetical protein
MLRGWILMLSGCESGVFCALLLLLLAVSVELVLLMVYSKVLL